MYLLGDNKRLNFKKFTTLEQPTDHLSVVITIILQSQYWHGGFPMG